jgi:3-hydroxybutyryl-CoA dehydrogenase
MNAAMRTIGVVGAGAMGSGIAQVAAAAGHRVILGDAFDGAARRARASVDAGLARLVEKGKMTG